MYVPSHLHQMLFELLKNSLRAVVETVGPDNDDNFPVIKVIIAEGKEVMCRVVMAVCMYVCIHVQYLQVYIGHYHQGVGRRRWHCS